MCNVHLLLQWNLVIMRTLGLWGLPLLGVSLSGLENYTGWPRKNTTTLIVNFKNIVNETELLFLFYLVEH